MRTWKKSGLLDQVKEKFIILNDPLPQEIYIALDHGFTIVQPKDIPEAKMTKRNVLTIGAAFYYALQMISSEYLLFLENDFKMDVELPVSQVQVMLLKLSCFPNSSLKAFHLLFRVNYLLVPHYFQRELKSFG